VGDYVEEDLSHEPKVRRRIEDAEEKIMTIDEKLELVASLIFVSKKYNEAIDLLNKALPDASTDEDYQGIYQGLSAAFEMIGNTSQAIACAKLAADYGNIGMVNYLENVFNINYTPQKRSSSSAPNSGGSSARPAATPKKTEKADIKVICPYCGFENTFSPVLIDALGGKYPCKECWKEIKF
jgi:hypothetical protein